MSLVDKLNYLLQTKELIKNAIIAKGVEVTAQDTFRSYVQKILDIPEGQIIYKDKTTVVDESYFEEITDSVSITENSVIVTDDSYFESITDEISIDLVE